MTSAGDRSLSTCGVAAPYTTTDWSQMAKLRYAAIASLDGYVEDEEGKFDWAMPDEGVNRC